MNIEDFRTYCLSLPDTEERMPFERFFRGRHSILAFYVRGGIYCYFDIDRFDLCTVRASSEQADELRERYAAVVPPYNPTRGSWIGLRFNDDLPDSELLRLVRQSYELVRTGRRPSPPKSKPKPETPSGD